MNVAVYTAIFGGRDTFNEPPAGEFDFYLFTDDDSIRSKRALVLTRPGPMIDPTRSARVYKVLSHELFPKYDYTLWIDGNIVLKSVDVNGLIKKYLDGVNLATFKHPFRECIYDEAKVCASLLKDDPELIAAQMEKYRKEKYPEKNGLVETGVLLRRNAPDVTEFNKVWWNEIENGSRRDQLSFNYAAWKTGLKFALFDGTLDALGFELRNHLR